jgi:hypothetical protein
MTKSLVFIAGLCILILTVISCGKSTPNCTDEDVTKLVIQIATDELRDQLTTQTIITVAHVNPALWGNPTYKNLKGREGTEAVVAAVDNQLKDISFKLEGIRIGAVDETIKKCQCGCNLLFSNGKSLPIEYTAQYTEDKMVYVEVSGLE